MPSLKKEWVLTQDAFDQLLTLLDTEQERAAERYEDLRQMLITFSEFRGAPWPDRQTDETINRVARKIHEGTEIPADKIENYFYAVARNVWREQLAEPHLVTTPLDALPPGRELFETPQNLITIATEREYVERRLECLEQCLQKLPTEQRELITIYYQGAGEVKIKSRKDLAARLGIPLNALRIRACRLRDKIGDCVHSCLKQFGGE